MENTKINGMSFRGWFEYYFNLTTFVNEKHQTLSGSDIEKIKMELGTIAHMLLCHLDQNKVENMETVAPTWSIKPEQIVDVEKTISI